MMAGRGARPANLTRVSMCDLHGWPTAPCRCGMYSSRSVRAGCVAGHRYGVAPCGWPASPVWPVWLPDCAVWREWPA